MYRCLVTVSLPVSGILTQQDRSRLRMRLTAGTLEYPEHLLAANFVDNFALGDNTNINLLDQQLRSALAASNVGIEQRDSPQGKLTIDGDVGDNAQADNPYVAIADF